MASHSSSALIESFLRDPSTEGFLSRGESVAQFIHRVLLVIKLRKVDHPLVVHLPSSNVHVKCFCVSSEKPVLLERIVYQESLLFSLSTKLSSGQRVSHSNMESIEV